MHARELRSEASLRFLSHASGFSLAHAGSLDLDRAGGCFRGRASLVGRSLAVRFEVDLRLRVRTANLLRLGVYARKLIGEPRVRLFTDPRDFGLECAGSGLFGGPARLACRGVTCQLHVLQRLFVRAARLVELRTYTA